MRHQWLRSRPHSRSRDKHRNQHAPQLAPDEVLVYVMASGINYNNVWPVLGVPLDMVKVQQRNDAPSDFHDGWQRRFRHRLGHSEAVTNARVVEHIVLHCGMCDVNAPFIKAIGGPIISASNRIWGYEAS